MTYLIGETSPTLKGIGEGFTFGGGATGARFGRQRKDSAVHRAICGANLSAAGKSTKATVPWNSWPMYSLTPPGAFNRGPTWRLAFDVVPLPLATNSRFPSGVTRTEVGYQPTGTKPSDRAWPGSETSKTASVLMFALATKRRFSSGDSASEFGVFPDGAPG